MYACCALCLGDMWPEQDGVRVCVGMCMYACSMFRRHVARAGRCACV